MVTSCYYIHTGEIEFLDSLGKIKAEDAKPYG